MKNEWTKNRVLYIDGLKKPSPEQLLLSLLYKLANRTTDQNRKLNALISAEFTADRLALQKAKVKRMLADEKAKEFRVRQKARAKQLKMYGELFELAGLETRSRGELLGMLMDMARLVSPEQLAKFKMVGDKFLAEHETTRSSKNNNQPLAK